MTIKTLIYFFMGTSLSMDTFSLSISLGIMNPPLKKKLLLSIIIGIFHFFMPLIGSRIGILLKERITTGTNLLTAFIFLLLAIQMFTNRKEEEKAVNLSLLTIIIISLMVSIDSLTVGFAYGLAEEKIILASTIFMIVSTLFTFLGLQLGYKLQERYQGKTIYIGMIIMFFMFIKYLISI